MEHESCDACAFDGAAFDDAGLLDAIRSLGPEWTTLLGEAGPYLRDRPSPSTWSAIEYAAHSRDITALHVFGVEQALTVDEPAYPAVAGEELIEAAAAGYDVEDATAVAAAITEQAGRLAELAEAAGTDAWARGLTIGTSRSDVRFLLEHALHDSHHHLVDVGRGLEVLRSGAR